MYKLNQSLANTKRNSQVFACLVPDKHNIYMDIREIRRTKLKLWFSERSIPENEKSYISQLLAGKASFGEKAARRLERTYKMPSMYLDDCEDNLGIDISKMTMEQLDFIKKLANMGSDEFRETAELFIAADEVAKIRKRKADDEGGEGDKN